MVQNLTATQVKENNAQAYSNIEKILKDLHKEDLEGFMELYGYVDVDHVIKHYIKFSNENGALVLQDRNGVLYQWDKDTGEWMKKGSIFIN